MKILIQLGHPAQFHFFKNAIDEWQKSGHHVRVLIRTKDVLENLLISSGFEYVNIEKKRLKKESKLDLYTLAIKRFYQLFAQQIRFSPDIVISPDPILAKICRFFPSKFIAAGEDDYAIIKTLANLLFPSVDHILAPRVCDYSLWQSKKIEFEGYMKLAYLHPNRFNPEKKIAEKYVGSMPYVIIRLVSLKAHHDDGIKGISNDVLDKIIERFKLKGYKIWISSEKELGEKYQSYKLTAPVELIHHIMAYSSFIVCDSQSMAVEAAMLGVPSIRFNDFAGKISVLEELEHIYRLTFGIKTDFPDVLFEKLDELLMMENLNAEFQARKQKMLEDKIDVTAFLVWFIENYPKSAKTMKENPDYQLRFK